MQRQRTISTSSTMTRPSPGVSTASTTKSNNNSTCSNAENVQVTVRCRPPSKNEHNNCWNLWEKNKVMSNDPRLKKQHVFNFDNVFYGSDNKDLYATSVEKLINQAMEGYNATVFAYGQTASGKTFTMMGNQDEPGVIPRSVDNVFAYIKKAVTKEFLLRVSYMEIYNETIRDLLDPSNDNLKIHQDKIRGVYVTPLTEEVVTCAEDVMAMIARGERNRHISSTDYNLHSSRSHTLFQMVIESRENNNNSSSLVTNNRRTLTQTGYGVKSKESVKISQLNLIDLAGSEKAATNEDRRKEGAYINKSLLTLGTVISKLTEANSSSSVHIPFRDSKLTRILQTALTGLAKVAVICTMSPSASSLEESVNTLKFASRVKKIAIHAKNDDIMDDKALIQRYRGEIQELKLKLQEQEDKDFVVMAERRNHAEQLLKMRNIRNTMKERIDHLTKYILTSNSVGAHVHDVIESTTATTDNTNDKVHQLQQQIKQLVLESSQKDQVIHQLKSEATHKDQVIYQLRSESREKDARLDRLEQHCQVQFRELSTLKTQFTLMRAEFEVNQILTPLSVGMLSPSSTITTKSMSLPSSPC